MGYSQDVLTTGQVAKICNVAPRTVSKWFDTGQLRGYRIPGSKDRRIPLDQLIRFMKAHDMPLNGLDGSSLRVLLVDADEEFCTVLSGALQQRGNYQVESAVGYFAAGVVAERLRPHVMLIEVGSESEVGALCRYLRGSAEFQGVRLVAIGRHLTDRVGAGYCRAGFDRYLPKPFDLAAVRTLLDELGAAAG